MHDPKYIITKSGELFTFNAWYMFGINGVTGSEWFGAQVTDSNGNSFGIHVSNIKTRIYEADKLSKSVYSKARKPNRRK